MDENISKLGECINCHQSEMKKMEGQWQKQQVMIQDLMTKHVVLEAREADREERITVQEDMIQILSAEVEGLKEKMCYCQDSPCISHWSSQAESPYLLEGESLGSSYVSAPVEDALIPIQGGERRGEVVTPEVDPNDAVPDQQVIRFRTFLDDMVVEGPYCPSSVSETLVDVPHDLPCLESPKPIPVPVVCLQCTVQSQGCPKSSYHSPTHSPSLIFQHRPDTPCYHPYHTPILAAKELIGCTWGSCQCLCCCSPEPTASGSSSGPLTGL